MNRVSAGAAASATVVREWINQQLLLIQRFHLVTVELDPIGELAFSTIPMYL